MEGSFPDIYQTKRNNGPREIKVENIEFQIDAPNHSRLVGHVGELQEQLKSYREELKKRDEMIQKLASLDVGGSTFTHSAFDNSVANGRSEIASMQVKLNVLSGKIRDKEMELDKKEENNKILVREIELLKQDNAKQCEYIQTLKSQMATLENSQANFDALKYRNNFAVNSLQEQYKIVQERNVELEARLKSHLNEKEVVEQMHGKSQKCYIDFVGRVSHLLTINDTNNIDVIINKIAEIVQENAMSKGRIVTLSEQVNACEVEMKASRETISRLVAEVGREQRDRFGHGKTYEELKVSVEKSESIQKDLERQVELLEIQLEATKKALRAAKDELNQRDTMMTKLECEKRESVFHAESHERQLQVFLDSIAVLLNSAYSNVPSTEEAIREKIKLLVRDLKDKSEVVSNLEVRLKHITRQFESQYENSKEANLKARHVEESYLDIKERIRILESELAAGDVLRDGLRADKEKFFKYMQKLGEIMKMDRINADIGFDMVGEGLIARAEQLTRFESDRNIDRTGALHNLQRKCRNLKEQLESKDLHLDLMRKKISNLEERVVGRVEKERDCDREELRNRKLERMLEKSQAALESARLEIVELKSQLMECSNLKITVLGQDKEMEGLQMTLEKLERVRQKQAKKISLLKDEVGTRDKDLDDKRSIAENAIQALSSELRTTKESLNETRRKEHSLLEFREVVARMLGLNMESLSIPDYEIINRLERLVTAHQSNVYTSFVKEEALGDMEEGFRSGYEDAARIIGRHRTPALRNSPKHDPRAHSPSPDRRDKRKY